MYRGISYLHILLGAGASLWPNVNAHLAAWHKGMYCLNGSDAGVVDLNSAAVVTPLYQLAQNDWWFHHINGCDDFPPAEGDFLDLPAGGSFTVEIASNQAKTSLSYNGIYASDWPDGNTYPEDYNVPTCIISPNMHTQNRSMAAGTAFAISYTSDIRQVTPENLVVFSVRYNTPWKRITSYDVPAAMPACPAGGCICAWGWVPNGCGQANMYHQPFKCKVTGATSTTPVASAKPPVWCEGNQTACTPGAKQMIYWNQLSGNNIKVDGYDLEGNHKSPPYNMKLGFKDGAQNDIFAGAASSPKTGSGAISNFDSGAGSPIKSTPSSSLPPSGSSPSSLPSHNPPSPPPSGNSTSPPPSGKYPSPAPSDNSTSPPPSGNSTSPPPSGKCPSPPPSGKRPSPPPSGDSPSNIPSGKRPNPPPSGDSPSYTPSGKRPSPPPSGNPPPSGKPALYGSYTPAGPPPSGSSSSSSTSPSAATAGKPNRAPSCSKSKKPHRHQHRQSRRGSGTGDW